MTFAEEDIEDDALIKEEVAPKLSSLATRNHGNILSYYRPLVEEDYGIPIGQDLADMLIRSLNDEGFSDMILNTEISLRQAKMNDIREEDLEFVMDLQEKFMDDDAEDQVGEFINRYMRTMSGGPLGGDLSVTDRRRSRDTEELEQMKREIRRERAKLESLREEIESKSSPETEQEESQSIDDLFEDDEEEQSEEEEVEERELTVQPDVAYREEDDDVPLSSEEGDDEQ